MSEFHACGLPARSGFWVWSGFQGASSQPGIDLGMLRSSEIDSRRRAGQNRGMEPQAPQRVVITSINVGIWNLTELLLKLSIAAIPAAIIVSLLYAFGTIVVAVLARR
jgi:hypothetical protein